MTPRGSLVGLSLLGVALFAVGAWSPTAHLAALFFNACLFGLAVADLAVSPSTRVVDVRRNVSPVLSVGTWNAISLTATNRGRSILRVELVDEPPEPSRSRDGRIRLEIPPDRELTGTYQLEPARRGRARFEAVHLRFSTVLGLWSRVERRALPEDVRVFPDIQAVRQFDLLAVKNRLDEIGVHRVRQRGRGGEFERLREYRREDELRDVDWKATAKYDRLISREFTVERNQNIVLLLDCGRSMGNETGGVTHLDRGLNAATILSYVALRQGDNVSLVAFSDRIERHVGPVRGRTAIQAIIQQLYDIEARWEAADYGLACEELLRRQRKRALVLLITHTLDEQHLDAISGYLRTLTSPHVLVCVFLRDVALSELANRVPESDIEAFHVAAGAELLATQTRRIAELRNAGVIVLEVLPHELSTAVVNQYLDVKARHLL